MALLETTAAQRRSRPLVLSTDNGPAYGSREIAELFARNRVMPLRSLPHTPQPKAWVERAIGELNEVCAAEEGIAAEEVPPRARPVLHEEQGLEGTFPHEEAGGNTGKMLSREALVGLWPARVNRARWGIHCHRLRGSRGYCTAASLHETRPQGEHLVNRGRFYEATILARSIAVLGLEEGRGRRPAEREAILNTMQRFRLITWTRGGAPISAPHPERVS